MNWWRKVAFRFLALFKKSRLDTEMDEEIRFHIERQTQANIAAGMKEEEARYAALRKFGWVESSKETCREQRGVTWPEHIEQDVRYCLRMLLKNPGFAAVAILTLVVGIGVNTAMFSLFNSLLLRTVTGVRDPNGLVAFDVQLSERGKPLPYFSYPDYLDFQNHTEVFEGIVAYDSLFANLDTGNKPRRIQGQLVSRNYFDVLGIRPVAGRTFLPEENEIPGAHPVAVISQFLLAAAF